MRPLDETEAAVLAALADGTKGTWTPGHLARHLGKSRQQVTPAVIRLEQAALLIAVRMHKMTYYEITQPGRNALTAHQAAS